MSHIRFAALPNLTGLGQTCLNIGWAGGGGGGKFAPRGGLSKIREQIAFPIFSSNRPYRTSLAIKLSSEARGPQKLRPFDSKLQA